MARRQTISAEAEEEKTNEEEGKTSEEAVEDSEDSNDSVDVLNSNGDFVRTYSLKLHGKNFKALAKEYAGKIDGKVK